MTINEFFPFWEGAKGCQKLATLLGTPITPMGSQTNCYAMSCHMAFWHLSWHPHWRCSNIHIGRKDDKKHLVQTFITTLREIEEQAV